MLSAVLRLSLAFSARALRSGGAGTCPVDLLGAASVAMSPVASPTPPMMKNAVETLPHFFAVSSAS